MWLDYNVEYSRENVFENIDKICEMFPVTILSVVNNTCVHDFVADG